jgi:hypothetical protein
MAPRSLSLALFCLWGLAPVGAQEKPEPTYDALLEQVKKADPKADFLKLRMVFTETAHYKPYGADQKEREQMTEALGKEEYGRAAESAEKVLKTSYVDVKAHFTAYRAYAALGKADQAMFHRNVFAELIRSILKSGDGKAPKTAYVVISTDEEYAVLGVLGIRRTGQALVGEGEQKFDRIDGVDQASNEPVTLYFNVSKQFNWLGKQLKKEP